MFFLGFVWLFFASWKKLQRVSWPSRSQTTGCQEELERSQLHRDRLNAAYRALSINDEPLLVCAAEGTPEKGAYSVGWFPTQPLL